MQASSQSNEQICRMNEFDLKSASQLCLQRPVSGSYFALFDAMHHALRDNVPLRRPHNRFSVIAETAGVRARSRPLDLKHRLL